MKNKAFTLIELLVVVLIIGILAAIAVPQYQKAVTKANLHKGVSLAESVYQAQQSYFLAFGNFATNFDDLDISIPKDESCTKTQFTGYLWYTCSFGTIGLYDSFSNVQFLPKGESVAYLHFLKDKEVSSSNITFEKDKRYCFAKPANDAANDICQSMGGIFVSGNTSWNYYKLD